MTLGVLLCWPRHEREGARGHRQYKAAARVLPGHYLDIIMKVRHTHRAHTKWQGHLTHVIISVVTLPRRRCGLRVRRSPLPRHPYRGR